MPRRRDENTIVMPGMEKFSGKPKEKRGQFSAVTAPKEFGGDNFGLYTGNAADNYNLPVGLPELKTREVITIDRPVLRDYQERARRALLWAISNKNPERVTAAAALMATGTGKTTLGASLAYDVAVVFRRRVLIICNQDELIRQWVKALDRIGITGLVEKAEIDATDDFGLVDEIVVVASQQTLQGNRLWRWPPDFFDLILHDECDLALCPTWEAIIDWFVGARHIGLTATPDRMDGSNITRRFPCIPQDAIYTIAQAIQEKWLVRPIEKRAAHEEIDLSKLRMTAGDFNKKDLDAIIRNCVGALAEASIPLMEGRPTIAYTPTVFTAQALAEAYAQYGLRAIAVSADTKDLDVIFDLFRAGGIDVLVNCNLITRGVDLPIAENVVIARPTASRALWCQMIGRIMRPYYDEITGYEKTTCRIINFAWKFQKKNHKLAHPTDLFDTPTAQPEVMERARAIYDEYAAKNPDEIIDIQDVIKYAEEQVKLDLQKRIKFEVRNIKARVTVLDPLALDILNVPQRPAINWQSAKPVTERQLEYLQSFKVDTTKMPDLNMNKATRLIDNLKERRAEGKASWPQVKSLISCKVPPDEAREFSFEEASAYLSENLPKQPWYKGR